MFEHFRANDSVERRVGKRQVQRVALDRRRKGRIAREFTGDDHRAKHGRDPVNLIAPGVEGHDHCAATGRLKGVTSESATEVQYLVAIFETQLVVVGGEHYSKVIDSGNDWPRRMAS